MLTLPTASVVNQTSLEPNMPLIKIKEKSSDDIKAELVAAVQKHLDTIAMASGYDNIVSACSYAGAANPFQAEGVAFVVWRGDVWAYCWQVLADVNNGLRSIPTAAELLAELPLMTWPD